MKKTLANYYLIVMIIAIAVITFTITFVSYITEKNFLEITVNDISKNIVANYKKELKNKVIIVEQYINGQNKLAESRLRQSISSRVDEAHAIANNLYTKYKDSKPQNEIQELIIASLRDVRFNKQRGYYFIDDIDGNCLLYPIATKLEGKNLLQLQDVNKKYVIKEFVDIAKEKGHGFSVYYANKYKYEKGNKFKKIAYVKLFKPYNMIIGAGEYFRDVENDIKEEITKEVNNFKSVKNGSYMHIYEIHDYQGGKEFATMVVNPNRHDLVGKKISSFATDIDGKKFREEILEKINQDGEGYVYYKDKKLNSEKISEKLVYVKRLKNWDWVLATSKHLDDLELLVTEHRKKAVSTQKKGQLNAVLIFVGFFIVLIIASIMISKKINFQFMRIINFFQSAAKNRKKINNEDFSLEDFKILANFANEMIDTIDEEEKKLKKLNLSLEEKVEAKTNELKKVNNFLESKNSELEKNYYTDYLTGLGNRNKFFKDTIDVKEITVVIFDIDGFKNVNDFYGLKTGDNLLISLANNLREFAKQNTMKIYRLSSDEFLLSIYEHMDSSSQNEFCKILESNIAQFSFFDSVSQLNITASLTFALAKGKENILTKVDMALNYAKENKFVYAIYDKKNHHMDKHKHNIYWREKIQWAIENDLVQPYFQRIVNYQNKEEQKYEALVRIIDDDEVISPYQFLEVAKETKQYQYITRIMIEKSFEVFHNTDMSFSINISMSDVENNETIDFLIQKIEEYNIHDQLILEILETEDMLNSKKFLPFVELMRSKGIRFALDDFGSGYSNFAFLLKMHPRFLKIDGSLIKNITKDKNSYKIVDTIVAFAKNMDSIVIAEFVENEEIVFVLDELGIQYMQGYHFSTPSPYFK